MEEVLFGADALEVMNEEDNGGGAEFTSFKSGSTFRVKLANMSTPENKEKPFIPALMSFFGYGVYKKVNSFVAANPSKKSKKGYPVEDLTPWDKAWKFHADKSKKFQDAHSQEAYKYAPKKRYVIAFINLADGSPIFLDFSDKQAKAVYAVIKKNEKKWDLRAFELTKEGAGTDTKVILSVIPDLDDEDEGLTATERKHYDSANQYLNAKQFDGILYELDEDAMITALHTAGFDVTKVGLVLPPPKETAEDEEGDDDTPLDGSGTEIDDDDLPF